jgi:ABC-2 type transport system ATP-binding protein
VQLDHLTKRFGAKPAVEDLVLDIPPGEIFGFLGPNGAGKTTTIKMLTGLLQPTAGRALVGGHDLQREPVAAKALIGYVPDEPLLYTRLTAREFLRFIADVYAVEPATAERRSLELFKLFELDERADDLIESFSHGMRQKTALIAALLHDPRLLVLDEPTVGLDPRSARMIKNILRRLAERGAAVFMSTHILEIAERMCDRVGIIQGGRLIAVGTMAELRQSGGEQSLEDIFMALTGGDDYAEIAEVLR